MKEKSDGLKARLHLIKIATDWLQTGSQLASDSKIGVNGTMLHQCNPAGFPSLKLVCSQLEASLKSVGWKFNFGVKEP